MVLIEGETKSQGGFTKTDWYLAHLTCKIESLNSLIRDSLLGLLQALRQINMHGSIMAYLVDDQNVSAWYASFKKEMDWKVDKTKGIDKENVETQFPI